MIETIDAVARQKRTLVNSFNEWDPLEEVVVGISDGARIPRQDPGLYALEFFDLSDLSQIPSGPFGKRVLDETAEDLDRLASALSGLGIVVRRPEPLDHSRVFRSPDWESDGFFNYCPRDSLLVLGDTIIETPMVLRARQYENLAYRTLLREYLAGGARWISAPKPRLDDRVYGKAQGFTIAIDESEPLFDAANVARCGRDLFYLVSDSGNHLGAQWLARTIGPEYRVHVCDRLRNTVHIDTTIVLVRPGLVLVPAPYVSPDNLPDALRSWEVVYVEDMADDGSTGTLLSSKWVGLNLLMINPSLAVVDRRQHNLIRQLDHRGIDTLQLELRHARVLGGGFHCVTLDVRRRGSLESYCD
jgi:N-dimethylarginine dimethylaminohydrolase